VTPYECMYILRPDLDEETTTATIERFREIVENQEGEIIKLDKWGKRRLAYPINDYPEGYYVLMQFKSPADTAKELERVQRISDNVLRFMTIKLDQ
jgi:small subunit ribosomal protein S6